jgi:hypothetical protein
MGFLFSFVSFIFLSVPAFASCDFQITKTMIPIGQKTYHENLCLKEYFALRDMAFQSLTESPQGLLLLVYDPMTIDFDDMILFKTKDSFLGGEPGRIILLRRFYKEFLRSLKNTFGKCKLQVFSEKKLVGVDDFKVSKRLEADLVGTRLMLTKDDVKDPHWQLLCPNEKGEMSITKSGKYFYIFIDIIENNGNVKLVDHLAKFLFALR